MDNLIYGRNMTVKKSILLALLVISTGYLSAQTLTIRVENAEIGRGYLMVGVFNDESNFPNNYFMGKRIAVTDTMMEISFTDLPLGQYAVSVFQDRNGNGRLDTNILGIPTERYGFSNDVRRPNFQRSLFDFNGNMTITIWIR
jgi:uncharacterized protein (DUF2141 family)